MRAARAVVFASHRSQPHRCGDALLHTSMTPGFCSPYRERSTLTRVPTRALIYCIRLFAARSAAVQTAQPTMSLEFATSRVADASTALLAVAKETDFGGYTGPAVGLVVLGILIAVLTNPYDDLKK